MHSNRPNDIDYMLPVNGDNPYSVENGRVVAEDASGKQSIADKLVPVEKSKTLLVRRNFSTLV